MTMERWIGEQERLGNKPGAEMGQTLLSLYGDVPLPGPIETWLKEGDAVREVTPVEVKRFSDEAREALTKEGYVIYELTGQSIRNQREGGKKFWSTWHQAGEYEAFETQGSMQSEVAINPNKLFIKDSNYRTLSQQGDLITKFSRDLGKKVKGVEAVMGNASDYVGLAFAHLDETTKAENPEYLFGEKYDYNYARTKTPTVEGVVALVGYFHAVSGLDVRGWHPGHGYGSIFAAPLVVPKA